MTDIHNLTEIIGACKIKTQRKGTQLDIYYQEDVDLSPRNKFLFNA